MLRGSNPVGCTYIKLRFLNRDRSFFMLGCSQNRSERCSSEAVLRGSHLSGVHIKVSVSNQESELFLFDSTLMGSEL